MRLLRLMLAGLAMLCFAGASIAAPVQGQDYNLLTPPQPTEPGKKVEVIEFFAYYCPHCNALDRSLNEWVRAQGDKIVFKRVHVSANGEPMPQQKLYFALESMGKVEEYHSKIFYAIHFQRVHMNTDADVIDFMVKQGMDRDKFTALYNSFTVQSKVNRAIQMMSAYKIDSWPTLIVDGKYVTSPAIAGARMPSYEESASQNLMLKVLDGLVDQAAKTHH